MLKYILSGGLTLLVVRPPKGERRRGGRRRAVVRLSCTAQFTATKWFWFPFPVALRRRWWLWQPVDAVRHQVVGEGTARWIERPTQTPVASVCVCVCVCVCVFVCE